MDNIRIVECVVEDYFAHTGQYMIRPSGSDLQQATCINAVPMLPLGARPLGAFPPKTKVLVLQFAGMNYIVGATGVDSGNSHTLLPDSMTMAGRAGFFEDGVHNASITDKKQLFGNYSAGRPADTLAGDWGALNDLGLAIFIGRMIASLKASDAAKVEAFWGDDLLRTVGYNYEHFTSCKEAKDFNDEGENHVVTRSTPFPWEALGVTNPNVAATDEVDGKLGVKRETSRYEPREPDQLMITRDLRLGGYLGDVDRRWIALPPNALNLETYKASTVYSGLSEVTRNLNGSLMFRSAKGISIEKYSLIPVPKEMIQPDDALGDDSTNYAAAGQIGSGDKPDLKEFTWGKDDNAGVRAAQLFDCATYLANKYFSPGLEYHKKDWKYPEESELTDMKGVVQSAVYSKSLKSGHKFRLDLPVYGELKIDDRLNHSTRYYGSRSGIHFLDDGSVLLEDGYGSQMLMSGGNIELSCVGDVWLRPGRSVINWAPRDVIIKAGNSVDISASKKDVRIKAEKNLHILGGNDGTTGGVLIESRSQGDDLPANYEEVGEQVTSKGITLKASKSSVNVFGKNISVSRGQTESGRILIDAGEQGYLLTTGDQLLSRAKDLHLISVQGDADPTARVLAINGKGAALSVPLQIEGDVTLVGGETSRGNLLVGGNLIAYGPALVSGGAVGPSDEIKRRYPAENMTQAIDDIVEKINEQTDDQIKAAVEDPDTAPGADDFQKRIGFSCRDTEEDLKLDESFVLYEVRWQQMLRAKGEDTTNWQEPEVRAPNGEITMPHPGRKGWQTDEAYATVGLVNYDLATGQANARDSLVADGEQPETKPLASGYPVNVQ